MVTKTPLIAPLHGRSRSVRTPVRLLVPLTALGLGLSVLPALGAPALPGVPGQDRKAAAPAAPFDYIAQAPKLSQPIYGTSVKEVVPMEAFDGEDLYVEVTRPDPAKYGNGPWPVILEASPYHGTVADREGTRMFPDPKDAEGNMLGLTGYFAKRGYAVVMMDLRGTGRSTGCLDHLGPNDQKDLKTVVEALADAPWSNGKIGMTGHSYVGSTPSVAAAQKPRGLTTIVPSAGLASMYDHQFNKGVPWNLQYIGPVVAYEGLALSRDLPPGTPAIPVVGGPTGDNAENGPNAQTGCGLPNSAAFAGPGQVTGEYEAWHAQRDSGAGAQAADIPIFMIHGANDNAARIPAAEWFFGGRFDRAQDKVWVGQWDHGSTNGRCGDTEGVRVAHPTCRFEQMQYAVHAWFDKHLAGRKVSTGPAVEAFLNGREPVDVTQVKDATTWGTKVVTDDAWSRPTSRLALYPDATDGSLRLTPPTEEGSTSFNGGVNAVIQGAGNGKAVFTSEPFAKDTVFLGLPELVLRASQSVAQVNHLTAALYRVEGDKRELANTCGIQPMLRFGVATPAPVVPGQAMDLPMQCFTAAQWVAAGQHLELEISTRTPHHASFATDPSITVFTGPTATRYALPTVPAVLHDDVRLYEDYVAPAPAGPAQPQTTGSVVAPVGTAEAKVEPLSVGVFPFTSEAGFDNAALEVLAEPQGVSDVDLTLQRKVGEEWEDMATGASFGVTEVLSGGRLAPGEYRIVVVNYAGVAAAVDLTLTFLNGAGVAGGTPDTEVDGAQAGFLPLP